jgi:hypothetical protein
MRFCGGGTTSVLLHPNAPPCRPILPKCAPILLIAVVGWGSIWPQIFPGHKIFPGPNIFPLGKMELTIFFNKIAISFALADSRKANQRHSPQELLQNFKKFSSCGKSVRPPQTPNFIAVSTRQEFFLPEFFTSLLGPKHKEDYVMH